MQRSAYIYIHRKKSLQSSFGSVLEMNCKLLISSRDTGYKDCICYFKMAFSVVAGYLKALLFGTLLFLKMAVR